MAGPISARSFIEGPLLQVPSDARTDARPGADWLRPSALGAENSLAPAARELLGKEWLEDALLEHASIAWFTQLTLELLALGAPPELVAASQRASLDGIEHAKICFSWAAQQLRHELGPPSIERAAAARSASLEELVARVIEVGCVGRTIASLLAAEQARHASERPLKKLLRRIAEDDARHAELCHAVLRWAIEQGGSSVATAVAEAFERCLEAARQQAPGQARLAPAGLLEHGRLDAARVLEVIAHACDDVIEPLADSLVSRISLRCFVCAELRPQSRRPPRVA